MGIGNSAVGESVTTAPKKAMLTIVKALAERKTLPLRLKLHRDREVHLKAEQLSNCAPSGSVLQRL